MKHRGIASGSIGYGPYIGVCTDNDCQCHFYCGAAKRPEPELDDLSAPPEAADELIAMQNGIIKQLEGRLSAAQEQLRALLFQPHAPRDHLTSCDRTMGASHPCTCHADEYRALLGVEQ